MTSQQRGLGVGGLKKVMHLDEYSILIGRLGEGTNIDPGSDIMWQARRRLLPPQH